MDYNGLLDQGLVAKILEAERVHEQSLQEREEEWVGKFINFGLLGGNSNTSVGSVKKDLGDEDSSPRYAQMTNNHINGSHLYEDFDYLDTRNESKQLMHKRSIHKKTSPSQPFFYQMHQGLSEEPNNNVMTWQKLVYRASRHNSPGSLKKDILDMNKG